MPSATCLYDAVQGPLIADLAPPVRLGRYLAVTAFTWQLGFIVGPALGAILLAANPSALWIVASAACTAGAFLSLRLDNLIPERARSTPSLRGPAA